MYERLLCGRCLLQFPVDNVSCYEGRGGKGSGSSRGDIPTHQSQERLGRRLPSCAGGNCSFLTYHLILLSKNTLYGICISDVLLMMIMMIGTGSSSEGSRLPPHTNIPRGNRKQPIHSHNVQARSLHTRGARAAGDPQVPLLSLRHLLGTHDEHHVSNTAFYPCSILLIRIVLIYYISMTYL